MLEVVLKPYDKTKRKLENMEEIHKIPSQSNIKNTSNIKTFSSFLLSNNASNGKVKPIGNNFNSNFSNNFPKMNKKPESNFIF